MPTGTEVNAIGPAIACCYSEIVHTIGIDIGGTEIKGGLVDEHGRILESARVLSEPTDRPLLLERISELIRAVSGGRTEAIGVGVPGLIRPDSGTVEFAPNMPALKGVAIGSVLSDRTGHEVFVRNDADMNAWGEFLAGAGVGSTHMICLTVGTGLGSGLIVKGQLYGGARGYGVEAGHMVIEPDGRRCGCGSHGCLETIVSATGIVALAREGIAAGRTTSLPASGENLTAKRILDAAEAGDALAESVYLAVGRALGIACATLINLLGPDSIVIGGGVSAARGRLLDPAIDETRARSYPQLFDTCRILPARLGGEAGVVGAALFARDRARG